MKPILIHCHIYYANLWSELKDCIKNINQYPYDLYVTMVEKHNDIINDIKNTFPGSKIEIVENRGYDLGPFVHVLNKVDLNDYDFIVKLHTKRDIPLGGQLNYFDMTGSKWRKYALEFISSTEHLNQCISAFHQNNKLGMISNYRLIVHKEHDDFTAKKRALALLRKLHIDTVEYGFVAGTMFIVRASLFLPLQKLHLNIKNFEIPDTQHTSSLAHVLERFLGCLVLNQKYVIADVLTKRQYSSKLCYFFRKFKRFIYRKKINKKGETIIKICKIPINLKRIKK